MMGDTNAQHRVRKRASNACSRCRQQKIKCSSTSPCEQCTKKGLRCKFDDKQQKVVVDRAFLAALERQAALSTQSNVLMPSSSVAPETASVANDQTACVVIGTRASTSLDFVAVREDVQQDEVRESPSEDQDSDGLTPDPRLINPLASDMAPSYTANNAGRTYYLGSSSNWGFGRRALSMAYEHISGLTLPATSLLFEGSTYDLGWDGRRVSSDFDIDSLPTADFALFLLNAVKFHCGQLYHLFDEHVFMHYFAKFYEAPGNESNYPLLWYIHYLLILAFGKAFIVRGAKSRKPPGVELFVEAMNMLPDTIFLSPEPVQSIEILCCAALYLQCLDHRSAAYNKIGQAMRIAVDFGMHTDMRSHHLAPHVVERCREAWWTVYVLDRQMSASLGVPPSLSEEVIRACMPTFGGSTQKVAALSLQVKLAKATAIMLQTVYGKDENFLDNMKRALQAIAVANDERDKFFPLDLRKSNSGVSRLAAYLHLFHHQSIIITTRPLLLSYWQKRLVSPGALRIPSTGGSRSLMRVCIGSAQQILQVLEALQSQSLLETFIPFDMEAAFSSAIVHSLIAVVDPSLIHNKGSWLQRAYGILDEMVSRGNLIAGCHKSELELLDVNIRKLVSRPIDQADIANQMPGMDTMDQSVDGNNEFQISPDHYLGEWHSEDGLTGSQLMTVTNSLDFGDLDLMDPDVFGRLDSFL